MSSSMGKLRSLFKRRKSKASTSAGGAEPESPPVGPMSPSFINDAAVREEMKRVFKKFDSNGDGKISSSELGAIFESLGHPLTENELSRMIGEADTDGDGFIGFEEFVDLNMVALAAALDDLRDAFSVFDLDRDGKISAEELACVMRRLGEGVSLAHCREMIAGVDQDGDGLVSFEEFKAMMSKSSTASAIPKLDGAQPDLDQDQDQDRHNS